MTERREIEAFLDALGGVSPNAATACAGWTAHELVAHLTSGVEAIASQAEAHLDGRPIPVFGSFAVREVAFWDVDDAALRRRLEDGERRMTEGLNAVRAISGDEPVPGIGWGMAINDVELHLRQEFALHRWDLVGDDDVGDEILARPELIDHSVRILSEPLLAVGRLRDPSSGEPFTARIRSPHEPDLVVAMRGAGSRLLLVDDSDVDADVECDAAARLLLLWGRRPAAAQRVRTTLDPESLVRLRTILSGY
jgi:uncharacterized protein (TIGR03083 family)